MEEKNYDLIELESFDEILYEHENLLRGIYEYGFTDMSRVQSKALQPIIDGVDTIVQSPAGTGKTAAYLVGGLVKINVNNKYPQMLIIVNTKELANQVYEVAKHLSSHMNLTISLCIGGSTNVDVQKNLDNARVSHLLIGTPGRLVDLAKRDARRNNKNKLLECLKILVLDEADRLLNEDFVKDIEEIVCHTTETAQICLFSATYPRRVLDLTQNFMKKSFMIKIERDKVSFEKVRNYYVDVEHNQFKYDVIVDLYRNVSICQAIIYVNSVRTANELAERLEHDGFPIGVTHAELDDATRIDTLKKFRLGQIRLLVGTDLISRGIDIEDVGLIINYDIPRMPDDYLHRVGRTARNGKLGVAITMVTNHHNDCRQMSRIENIFKFKFICLPALDNVSNFLVGKNGYNFGGS